MTIRAVLAALLLCPPLVPAGPAGAAEEVEKCPDMVAGLPVVRIAAKEDRVRLTFVGHASFLIESPAGVTAVTDYNDIVRPNLTPTIVTMNRAHSTHNSAAPQPGVKHILRGWGEGGPARHDLTEGDMRVRNTPTNLRDYDGGTDYSGNSIFVFETAGVCIAHLGHLHHRLTPEHRKALGHVDVVLAPVDGAYTMGARAMLETVQELRAPLTIPMHFFGPSTLQRFLDMARETFAIERPGRRSIEISRSTLPTRPTVIVLEGH